MGFSPLGDRSKPPGLGPRLHHNCTAPQRLQNKNSQGKNNNNQGHNNNS
jgi:hypothetical protein